MAKQKKKTEPAAGTVVHSQRELAQLLGVSAELIPSWLGKGCPGSPRHYVVRDVIEWARTEGPWKPKKSSAAADWMDPSAASSPALERYRNAKANHAEMDLERRKAELVDRGKCRDVLTEMNEVIRKAGKRLAKKHGPEAQRIVDRALDEAQRIIDTELTD